VASRSWVKAHSRYWSLHVEAWRQSGMACADYCRQHGLSTKTFERWMKQEISKEEAREHARSLQDSRRQEQRRQRGKSGKRHLRPRYSVRTDTRSRALQAFWAMHVEAMNWSYHLFAGSDGGGHRWAVARSLIETCKLNDVEPYAYLRDVLQRMVNGQPVNRLDELPPWNWSWPGSGTA
jgi:IS66 C-terminal element